MCVLCTYIYIYIHVIYVYTVWIQFYVSLREATECAVFIGRSGCVKSIYHINDVFLHWKVLYKFYFDFISNMIIPNCIHRFAAKAAICLCFAQLWLYQEPCLQRIRSINIFAVDRKGLWCPSVPSIWCHTWCVTCPNLRNLVLGGCCSWFKCGLQCVCVWSIVDLSLMAIHVVSLLVAQLDLEDFTSQSCIFSFNMFDKEKHTHNERERYMDMFSYVLCKCLSIATSVYRRMN